MKEEQFIIPFPNGEHLACWLYRPEAASFPLLIAVHGFSTNHGGQKITALTRALTEKGWGVLTCDLRFHGESSGQIEDIEVGTNVDDVRALCDYAKDIDGVESMSLYGSSYGGMLGSIVAIERKDIMKLGLVAPVTDFVAQHGIAKTREGVEAWKHRGVHARMCGDKKIHDIGYQFYESMLPYHEKIYDLAPKITAQTFITQGDADTSVPLRLTQKFFDALQVEKEIVIVPGADHKFSDPVQFDNMIQRLVDFYTRFGVHL